MTTQEVAKIVGVADITVRTWAAANGVAFTGVGRRKTYLWTKADVERFKARDTKRGRRWPGKG